MGFFKYHMKDEKKSKIIFFFFFFLLQIKQLYL